MRVAAIQMCPTFKDKMGNLRVIAKLVQKAAEAEAKLIVLPELATTGYVFSSPDDAGEYAEVLEPSSITMRSLMALSESFDAHIACGLIERDPGTKHLYNSQVLVSPDRTWVSYRKINRCGSDYLWAKEGRSNPPVVQIQAGDQTYRVGLLICRDVRDKRDSKWSDFYESGDADVVAYSAAWGRSFMPANAWMDFVEDNNTALVAANRYGQEGPADFGPGGSCIIRPPDQVCMEGLVWGAYSIVIGDV